MGAVFYNGETHALSTQRSGLLLELWGYRFTAPRFMNTLAGHDIERIDCGDNLEYVVTDDLCQPPVPRSPAAYLTSSNIPDLIASTGL